MPKVIIPLPQNDFDPTEAGVTWLMLRRKNIQVRFATPLGDPARADDRMVTGRGLGPWAALLKADHRGLNAYDEMRASAEFKKPLRWQDITESDYDGLALPGGHAPGMKPYLESPVLHDLTARFFASSKPVGAICHGVVLAARSRQAPEVSVLAGRRATALLRSQELAAWSLTCLWLGNYYRTYSETVQSEVTRSLSPGGSFVIGPAPLRRDSAENLQWGFVVEDGSLITARWPGDAHRFGLTLAQKLLKRKPRQ